MEDNAEVIDVVPQRFLKSPLKMNVPKVKIPRRAGLIIFILIVMIVLYNSFLVYVGPNEYGIKQVKIGINRGIQKKIYSSGLHFIIPVLQRMHYLPRDVQVLELTNYPGMTASHLARQERAAHIQTSDGFFVDVDVSILYHIADPYMVFTKIGPGSLFEDNGIIPKTEPVLKDSLGKLTTEEFYNSPLRVERAQDARDKLNQELQGKGLYVDQVLVRYFIYSDEIQKNIEEKKLKDQLVFKNQAEARAAVEEAILKKIEEEGKVNVSVEMEKGAAYVTRKRAEKDLYARSKRAEADLLVKLADAEKTRLKNEALKGTGAERIVGLKMAEVYQGLELIILPSDGPSGVNPLDLDKALKLFDVRQGGAR